MLASITPLGERGRHSHWTITVVALLLASASAGAAAGGLLGEAGALVLAGVDQRLRLGVLAAALLVAVGLDLGLPRVPGPRRQVDERWLHLYRGWVYGLGYGAQFGVGVATVVSSAATYVAWLAAGLTGSAGQGALIVGGYGAIRGLTPLLAAGVRTTAQLMALHAGLARRRDAAARAGVALLAAALIVALASAA